jgi:phosphotriesterase-related protein
MAFVNTVLGAVDPAELGVTLPHEHVLVDLRKRTALRTGLTAAERALAAQPVSLENLGFVRFNQEKCLDNLQLSDPEMAIRELLPFKLGGGGTVVDLTPGHAGRDPLGLIRVARATELHLVMGTGIYLDPFHGPEVARSEPEELAATLAAEISVGVPAGQHVVRAGIIGEMGCSWPLTPGERKALVAAALAQQQTGAAVSIHPGRHPDAPAEILDVVLGAGADPAKVIICHIDRTLPTTDSVVAVLTRGVYVEMDLFGQESSHIDYGPVRLPRDLDRLHTLRELAERGFADRLLISQDIALKHMTSSYGGHGYAHIVDRVVPNAAGAGVEAELIEAMLVANPAAVLAVPGQAGD